MINLVIHLFFLLTVISVWIMFIKRKTMGYWLALILDWLYVKWKRKSAAATTWLLFFISNTKYVLLLIKKSNPCKGSR